MSQKCYLRCFDQMSTESNIAHLTSLNNLLHWCHNIQHNDTHHIYTQHNMMTISIVTLSIMTMSITTLNIQSDILSVIFYFYAEWCPILALKSLWDWSQNCHPSRCWAQPYVIKLFTAIINYGSDLLGLSPSLILEHIVD